MSVLDKNGLGDWLADRLVEIGDRVVDKIPLRIDVDARSVPRRAAASVANLPAEPQSSRSRTPCRARARRSRSRSSARPGEAAGARRAISEIIKWLNYVTDNRVLTAGRGSLGVGQSRARQPLGPLRSRDEPARHAPQGGDSGSGQRVDGDRARQPERLGRSRQVRRRLGVQRHVRRVHAADVSAGARLEPAEPGQQVPDRRAAHSRRRIPGPETAADARTHFGIFSPQVWKLFPRGQVINLSFWDYNDVAPGYFAAAEIAAREKKVGIIAIEVARPDLPVADRSTFADTDRRGGREGAVRDSRLRARRPAARLRRCAGRERDVQPRQGPAEAGAGRRQRQR